MRGKLENSLKECPPAAHTNQKLLKGDRCRSLLEFSFLINSKSLEARRLETSRASIYPAFTKKN